MASHATIHGRVSDGPVSEVGMKGEELDFKAMESPDQEAQSDEDHAAEVSQAT